MEDHVTLIETEVTFLKYRGFQSLVIVLLTLWNINKLLSTDKDSRSAILFDSSMIVY
jgi:hypothetical protein